jgi:hypothetical protein
MRATRAVAVKAELAAGATGHVGESVDALVDAIGAVEGSLPATLGELARATARQVDLGQPGAVSQMRQVLEALDEAARLTQRSGAMFDCFDIWCGLTTHGIRRGSEVGRALEVWMREHGMSEAKLGPFDRPWACPACGFRAVRDRGLGPNASVSPEVQSFSRQRSSRSLRICSIRRCRRPAPIRPSKRFGFPSQTRLAVATGKLSGGSLMWQPQSPAQPSPGWWTELEFDRWVAGIAAEVRAKRQAEEQAKRLRQLRRKVEQIDEAIVLAQSASEARRHLRRQGLTYERSVRSRDDETDSWGARGEVEHSAPLGRILSVR